MTLDQRALLHKWLDAAEAEIRGRVGASAAFLRGDPLAVQAEMRALTRVVANLRGHLNGI
jgi:hypothetical protein